MQKAPTKNRKFTAGWQQEKASRFINSQIPPKKKKLPKTGSLHVKSKSAFQHKYTARQPPRVPRTDRKSVFRLRMPSCPCLLSLRQWHRAASYPSTAAWYRWAFPIPVNKRPKCITGYTFFHMVAHLSLFRNPHFSRLTNGIRCAIVLASQSPFECLRKR